ncbi:CAP domain-containing protein [uncultured Ferrovibrio sp.]|jgi:Uncharacterized protein with SCP/PR1 domains|uniref:CAP domain-containing protein n=1 Tax=uncultured Ferrovibrio sp. TaxID=1576913 RepID=UPI002623D2F0|nr:CAP domain-containing protein [uncultured Ferrovibrio sp.]
MGGSAAAETSWQNQLLAAVNATRATHNLALLRWSDRLAEAALAHAADLQTCGKLSHEGCDGGDLRRRLHQAGYRFRNAAENIALCLCDPSEVVRLWMNSEGHRRNLLDPSIVELGGSRLSDREDFRRDLWVLVLGRE